MSIVKINDEEIILHSGMTESAFGKTNYASIITQTGVFFDGSDFNLWSFNEVKAVETSDSKERQVVYGGKNPFNKNGSTKPLKEFFETAEASNSIQTQKNQLKTVTLAVCNLLTNCAKNNIELPKIGGGGIIINLPDSETQTEVQILFLPQYLYEGSVAGLSENEYALENGCWFNNSIYDLASLCFQRAVIAYRVLTGTFPFSASNLAERNADIYDQKFLPVELCVNEIDSELAIQINKGLKLNASSVNIPGKRKKRTKKEDLTPTAEFPLEKLKSALSNSANSKLSDEELSKKAEKYMISKSKKIQTKRLIRRNVTAITITSVVCGILSIMILNYVRSNGRCYSSRGLNSTQTIEALFMGVNSKDTSLLDTFTKGKAGKRLVNTISRIYVIGKQRMTYDGDNGFASPENWILYLKDESFLSKTGLYGVTNVRIDGKLSNLDVKLHTKSEKVPPVTSEKGITLEKGMQSVHQVNYFLLHSEGEQNELFIEDINEIYTLTYLNEKWIITDIQTSYENVPVDSGLFYMEYFNLVRNNNNDQIKAVQMLSIKYPWLPQIELVKKEQQKMQELINNPYLIFQK